MAPIRESQYTADSMTNAREARQRLSEQCEQIWRYDPPPGQPRRGAGSASGGRDFEDLVREYWDRIAECAQAGGAEREDIRGFGKRRIAQLSCQKRMLFLPTSQTSGGSRLGDIPADWLQYNFKASDLVNEYPGADEAIRRYAPDAGPYAQQNYPEMYSGLSTRFDGSVVLVSDGVLHEKILIECKTAKAGKDGEKMEGNAHERLTFQMMQYLEIATRYPRCTLLTISNGAYVRYRNKYHVNLHIQADRLSNFAWFSMQQVSTASGYLTVAEGLVDWLIKGRSRPKGRSG